MKTSPSHRIRLKVRANARPLNANEAIRGSPSPWNVLIMMPTQAAESVKRLHASAPDRVVVIIVQRTTIVWFPGLFKDQIFRSINISGIAAARKNASLAR